MLCVIYSKFSGIFCDYNVGSLIDSLLCSLTPPCLPLPPHQLASIRARRARLEALTASIRLPPLVPSDVLPSSPPASRMSPRAASRASLMHEGPLRRITWDDRPPTGLSSPEPRLPLTLPRMA